MKVFIVSAVRTAIGKFLGSLSRVTPVELGVTVVRKVLSDTGIDPSSIDELIVGNVLSAGQRQGIARQIGINSGLPDGVPAYGINMICGSGLKSIMQGYVDIISGQASVVLSGGTESMSQSGYLVPGLSMREGVKMGDFSFIDTMVYDGLTDAFSMNHMGITAENVAERYNISRSEQDAFAFASQSKAIKAIDGGLFKNEIAAVTIPNKKGDIVFDTDEYPNRSTNIDKLSGLRPAFKKDGSVTAGNSSGINDGSSFVLLASEESVRVHGLTPLCEIIGIGQAGVSPDVMGIGPVPAIKKALAMSGLSLTDIDVLELNEAFAAQSLGVMKLLSEEHSVDID